MPLPKIDKPVFYLKVPSQKREVLFRPFVVREEKILLMAQQSGQDRDIILAIKQVVQNCAEDPQFDADTLTTFDLEYLFLKLRARSVNNIIEVSYRDNEDDKVYKFEIDLDNVEMLQEKEIDNKIQINDTVGIIMKYPSVTIIDNAPKDIDPAEMVEHLIRSCIEAVYDENDMYPANEYTKEELDEFINDLNIETYSKIREFFESLPQLYYKIEYTNSMNNARVIELNSLNDFFILG